ncbi:MAG: response regulator [Oscillospiraceae bacterium]|nr:response regulator [Oscillospiraceae bacterium]
MNPVRILRFLPILFAVVMAVSFARLRMAVDQDRSGFETHRSLMESVYEMRDIYDFLAAQTESYVRTGSGDYLVAYVDEHNAARSKERIISDILAQDITTGEQMLTAKVRECADSLAAYELRIFSTAQSKGTEAAREMIWGDDYRYLKLAAYGALEQLRDEFSLRHETEAARTRADIETALLYVILSALAIVLVSLLYVFYAIHRRKNIERLAGVAEGYIKGDFSGDLSGFPRHDEQGRMASALSGLRDRVLSVAEETGALAKRADSGNPRARLSADGYDGQWRDFAGNLNRLLAGLEDMTAAAPEAYILIEKGAVAYHNAAASKLLALQTRMEFSELFVYGEDYDGLLDHISGADPESGFLARLKTSDIGGGQRRCRMYVRLLAGAGVNMSVWIIDIEELVRENMLAIREKDEFSRIIDSLPMAVVLTDPVTTEIIYANNAYLRLFETPDHADIIGFRESNLYFKDTAAPGESRSGEYKYRTHAGNVIDTRVEARPVRFKGNTVTVKVIHDLAAEKQQISVFQNAAEHEREANSHKNRFLIGISRKMRAPMNIIIGLSQLALLNEQNSWCYDTLLKINSSAHRLMNVVNSLLDFSKLEDQKIYLAESEFNLEDVIASAFMLASSHIEDKPVEMLLDIRPDVPYILYGDKIKLWQVLKGLLENAARYTDAGHVLLRVSVKQPITGKAMLRFEVEDTGAGMDEKQLEGLFTPFSQPGYSSIDHSAELSMAVTKHMVNLMSGHISVSSAPGKGSHFNVELPFQIADSEATIVQMLAGYSIHTAHILVVDGDKYSCDIMEKLLGQLGLIPVLASTGAEALEIVSERLERGEPFDLVITDYRLEDTTGIELAHKLLSISPSVKLLMIATQVPDKEKKLFEFADVIQKPLVPSVFVSCLQEALETGIPIMKTALDTFENVEVLLVEDNTINQEIGVNMLEVLGIKAVIAGNGKEAIELLNKQSFHAVLMDIIMPVMDGMEATRSIRRSPKSYRDIPIVAMTAGVMSDQIEEYMSAGMNGVVGKPLEFEKLSRELARILPVSLRRRASRIMDYAHAGFDIEDIDVSTALARFGGDETKYREALLRFADDLSRIEPYDETLANRDKSLVYYHMLISGAANLGALKLARMIRVTIADLIDKRPKSDSHKEMCRFAAVTASRIKSAVG